MRHAALVFGEAAAIAEPGGPVLTYRDLLDRSRTVARALIAAGIGPGDRIAIWCPNTHHWVLAALGTLYSGATLVPVNTRFTGHEALDVIGRSRARGLIVADEFLGTDRLAALVAAAAERADPLPRLIVGVPIPGPGRPSRSGPPAG